MAETHSGWSAPGQKCVIPQVTKVEYNLIELLGVEIRTVLESTSLSKSGRKKTERLASLSEI
ncbi:MAG TPA: hypothetical protein PJ981_08710 [Accumulibacter sp.]|nr:hypothetical protein [Accumulibacter sp.]